MLRQIIQIYLLSKFINITSKGVKLVYGYKSRGYCERSPDEGEEWPEMDFYRASWHYSVFWSWDFASFSLCRNSYRSSLMVSGLFCISGTSVLLQNKFVNIWKINNPVGKFNKMDPRTDANIQIEPSNWDYRCQDRRQIQAIGGKYPQVSIIQKWQIAHITHISTVMSHFLLPHWLVLTYNGVLIITVCECLLSDFGKHPPLAPPLASTILPTYIFLH